MRFSTRRGRPRKSVPSTEEYDHGTPELRQKRRSGMTAEAIDLCLAHRLITPDQHWCGMHFRWLHTLRYGVADARTSHALHRETSGAAAYDEQWTMEREAEYSTAIEKLSAEKRILPVMRLCIYNEWPEALGNLYRPGTPSSRHARNTLPVCQGLDILQAIWIKRCIL